MLFEALLVFGSGEDRSGLCCSAVNSRLLVELAIVLVDAGDSRRVEAGEDDAVLAVTAVDSVKISKETIAGVEGT